MPAKSKSQQRLFGMVHAYQKGELKGASDEVKDIAKSISKKDAEDFAETKHKGLPNKVKKTKRITEAQLRQIIKESVKEYTEQQIIETLNGFIKKNIGRQIDDAEEAISYELGIGYYTSGTRRLRSHYLRTLRIKGTDIWVYLLYGQKDEEWGYVYDLIDGIAAEYNSPKFKEFKDRYYFPNGRKNSKIKNNKQQTDIKNEPVQFYTTSTDDQNEYVYTN